MRFRVGSKGRISVWVVRDGLRQLLGSRVLRFSKSTSRMLLNRGAFVRATSKMFPGLERWTWWCYNQPPLLVYDHKREFFSQSGVQQGDPLGPLYFCCGLQSVIDQISEPAYVSEMVYGRW